MMHTRAADPLQSAIISNPLASMRPRCSAAGLLNSVPVPSTGHLNQYNRSKVAHIVVIDLGLDGLSEVENPFFIFTSFKDAIGFIEVCLENGYDLKIQLQQDQSSSQIGK